jgi:hypothetical protein
MKSPKSVISASLLGHRNGPILRRWRGAANAVGDGRFLPAGPQQQSAGSTSAPPLLSDHRRCGTQHRAPEVHRMRS